MTAQPKFKYSKEFQIKLNVSGQHPHRQGIKIIRRLLKRLHRKNRLVLDLSKAKEWCRRGERFDTREGHFKDRRISLATEKSSNGSAERTKLKCKLHNFVPELLYASVKDAACFPVDGGEKKVETRFKREQDIHFNNVKYCATGYMTLPHHNCRFKKAADFYRFFPNLGSASAVKPGTRLTRVKHWNEQIWDDVRIILGNTTIKCALVTRVNRKDGTWDETEFSFKIAQQQQSKCPDGGWDHDDLKRLFDIYQRLFQQDKKSEFIHTPSIFYFDSPVSSHPITLDRKRK